MRRVSVLLPFLLSACHGFSLSEWSPQQTVPVTVEPASAYAGQTLKLTVGEAVDPAEVQVLVGGQLLAARALSATELAVEMPRYPGLCEGSYLVQLVSGNRAFQSPSVGYLGTGHPGNPSPHVVRRVPVALVPTSMAGNGFVANLVVSTYGELALALWPGLDVGKVTHLEDFIAGIGSPGTGQVVAALQGGGLRHFFLNTARPLPSSGFEVETSLPSPILQAPSFAFQNVDVVSMEELVSFDALLFAPANRVVRRFAAETVAAENVLTDGGEVLGTWLGQAPASGAAITARLYGVVRGGLAPALALVDAQGNPQAEAPLLLPKGQWTPLAVPPSTEGNLVAALRSESGATVVAVGAVDASAAAPAFSGVGLTAIDSAPITGLAVREEGGDLAIFAVDGAEPLIREYYVSSRDEPSLSWSGDWPLAEPATRLTVLDPTPSSFLMVASSPSGRFTTVSAVGTEVNTEASGSVPIGLSALGPTLGASCGSPSAVAASSSLRSLVVAPTVEGGSPAAFLEGLGNARAVGSLTLSRPDGGADLTYFLVGSMLSDGDVGLAISQTAAQIRDLETDSKYAGQVKRMGFHNQVRALAAEARADDPAKGDVLAGGPDGLLHVSLEAGHLAGALVALDDSCPNVYALAAIPGTGKAAALAPGKLCVAGFAGGPADVVDLDVRANALAAATSIGADGVAATYVYLASWGVASGQPRLEIRRAVFGEGKVGAFALLEPGSRAAQRLPTGGSPIAALAVSPDGRRLLVAFGGDVPGILSLDPVLMLPGSEATEQEKAESVSSVTLSALPLSLAFTSDGAQAVAALADDTLAVLE